MARINTKHGIYKFKQVDLYAGSKRIDKKISLQNLFVMQECLDTKDIYWGFIFGTILGAVREKDFITHDEDIDLFILDIDEEKLKDSLFELRDAGFELIRYDKGGIYSFSRSDEYIDFYIFKPFKKGIYNCGTYYVLEKHLKDSIFFDFLGGQFRIPKEYKEYLEITYGDDWYIPIEYFNFDKTKMQVLKERLMVRVKRFMPQCLFNYLQYKHGAFRRERFYQRISSKNLNELIQ